MISIERRISNQLREIARTNPDAAKRLAGYFNEMVRYNARIELDNFALSCRVHRLTELLAGARRHEQIMRDLLTDNLK